MSFLGIEFNDVAITGVRDGRTVFAEPGCALTDGGNVVFGSQALGMAYRTPRAFHDRYWRNLSEQPVATGITGLATHADLAHAQLLRLWELAGSSATGVAFAVPSYWSRDQLALLLGIGEEIGMPVAGITDIPIAASRRPYPDHELIHIDVHAHSSVLSTIDQHDSPTIAASELVESLGIVAMRRSCAEFFARCFLERSRFDPLHDAASEQRVYDQLDEWVALLNKSADAELNFDYEGNRFVAKASARQLADSLSRRCQPLLQALRSRLVAGSRTVLQTDSRLAAMPGVARALQELPGCVVITQEEGAAARGLTARHAGLVRQGSGISISTTLPWDQAPGEIAAAAPARQARAAMPSHLVLDGTAYRLNGTPLRIGTEAIDGEYGLVVSPRHGGVSRRHCSIEIEAGQVVLSDHSRYGTRLNGHRVDGSVVLQAGDVISIGDPPCELKLITEIGPDGT